MYNEFFLKKKEKKKNHGIKILTHERGVLKHNKRCLLQPFHCISATPLTCTQKHITPTTILKTKTVNKKKKAGGSRKKYPDIAPLKKKKPHINDTHGNIIPTPPAGR